MEYNHDGISFILNNRNFTAKISKISSFDSFLPDGIVFIPQSIFYNSKKYIIDTICENALSNNQKIKTITFPNDSNVSIIEKFAFSISNIESIEIPRHVKRIEEGTFNSCFHLKTVKFAEDSELQSIEKDAFLDSTIESINIPSNFESFQNYWCKSVKYLTQIKISPKNRNFIYLNDQLIVGKSDSNNEFFDNLIFSRRDIKKVTIPSFIKKISAYSFEFCTSLNVVKFSEESQIQSIERNAFSESSINHITIPRHITKIKSEVFYLCKDLEFVEFASDSELQIIGKYAFSMSGLKRISIPDHVTKIKSSAFYLCKNLSTVTFSNNSELNSIGKEAFLNSSIETVEIPCHVQLIKNGAFSNCEHLKKITFSENSELQSIGESAFSNTSVVDIEIPRLVRKIREKTFSICSCLNSVSFSNDSELRTISENAFINSSINQIFIPAKFKCFEPYWWNKTPKNLKVSISTDNKRFLCINDQFIIGKSNPKIDLYDDLICVRDFVDVFNLPSYIKNIRSYAFASSKLKNIFIPEDSKLEIVEDSAFYLSLIKSVSFPSTTYEVSSTALNYCSELKCVEFLAFNLFEPISFCVSYSVSLVSIPNSMKIKFKTSDLSTHHNITLFTKNKAVIIQC